MISVFPKKKNLRLIINLVITKYIDFQIGKHVGCKNYWQSYNYKQTLYINIFVNDTKWENFDFYLPVSIFQ